jgi:hypothetical protein
MAHDVFICHANQDKKTADAVYAALEKNGIKCWMAPRDIPAGKKWDASITEALPQSRALVIIFSKYSNVSDYCINEVGIAFERKLGIFPIRIDDTIPSGAMELYLRNRQWTEAQKPPLKPHLKRLVDEVRQLLPQPAAVRATEETKKVSEPVNKAVKKPEIKKPIKLRKIWLGVACIILAIAVIGVTLKYTVFTEEQATLDGGKETVVVSVNASENVTPTTENVPPTTENIPPTTEVSNLNYIEGYVFDTTTNAPIADAIVDIVEQVTNSADYTYEVKRASGYSDSKGYYKTRSFNGTGKYFLKVTASGYIPLWHEDAWDITQAKQITFKAGETFNINFFILKYGTISGKIISTITGKAFYGTLTLYLFDAAGHLFFSTSVVTNKEGEYTAILFPGDYYIRFENIYYDNCNNITDATLVKVTPGEDTPNLDFYLDIS